MLGIAIAFLLTAGMLVIPALNHPGVDAQAGTNSLMRAQITATPVGGDNSVIGSTNGIVVMGILIVIVAVTPVFLGRYFLHRKKK